MRRILAGTLSLALSLGGGAALAQEQPQVMQTVLSLEAACPDQSQLEDIAIRAREELGIPIREVTYAWQQGKFSANVTFGSTWSSVQPLKDTAGRFETVRNQAAYDYLLYLPENYDPARRYPAVLFLHGIGERGADPSVIADYGPFQYILRGNALDMLVIAPQVETSAHWVEDSQGAESDVQMERLWTFLEQMCQRYAVDTDRIYLTGLSMGGRGAYKLACRYPQAFAAVAICCGRAGQAEAPEQMMYDLTGLAELPVWLFHGLSDRTVAPNHALRAMEALRRLQPEGNFRLTLYPGVGHGCYERAYLDPALYDWMAGWQREKANP